MKAVAAIMDGVAAEDQMDASTTVWRAIQSIQGPFLSSGCRLEPTEITLEPTASDKIFTYKLDALLTRANGETQELAFTGNIQLDEDGLVDFMKVGGQKVWEVLGELEQERQGYRYSTVDDVLAWPVPAYTGYHTYAEHEGLDILAPEGAVILSVSDGTVLRAAEDDPVYGKYLEIDAGEGRLYTYAHCGALLGKEGDAVTRGQMCIRDSFHALAVTAQGQGAHSGDGHQKILVKDLTVHNAQHGLAQDVVADDQIGDQIQRQLCVFRRGDKLHPAAQVIVQVRIPPVIAREVTHTVGVFQFDSPCHIPLI